MKKYQKVAEVRMSVMDENIHDNILDNNFTHDNNFTMSYCNVNCDAASERFGHDEDLKIIILNRNERDNQIEVIAFLIQKQYLRWTGENNWSGVEELQNDSSPEEILQFAERAFCLDDLSAALIGDLNIEDNINRPPFTVGIREGSYEEITIPIDTLMEWYSKNKD